MPPIRRLFAPLAALFAALGAWRSIASPDTFWHLTSGRWMLDNGRIPRHDPFRFSSGGEAWVDHEWGFQLLLAGAERVAGLAGVQGLRALIFAALACWLWRLAMVVADRSRHCNVVDPQDRWLLGAAAFALLVTIDGLQGRMPLRPELLTLCFFAGLLWILETARTSQRRIWWVLPLTLLWVNCHPGALAAPGFVFAHLLGRRLQPDLEAKRPTWPAVCGLPAATVAVLGANPWGFEVVALPFRIRAALADLPATNPDWRRLWQDPPHLLLGVLGLLVVYTVLRQGRGVDWPAAFVLLAATSLMVVAVRFQSLVWIAAFVFVAHVLASMRDGESTLPFGERFAAFSLCLLVLGCGVEGWRATQAAIGVVPNRFPAAGVAALDDWHRDVGVGNLFNSAVFGGYVLYESFPPRQIFVDTRNEVDPAILRRIAEARSDARAWRALVDDFALDAALLRYEDRPRQVLGPAATPGARPTVEFHTTSALLFPPGDWALVHWDDVSMLFLRRSEERAGTLEDAEYRFVQPENVQATLQRAARDPSYAAGMAAELERKLTEDPDCARARAILSALRPDG